MKRRVIISGWVGRGNYGDELIAYALRRELIRLIRAKTFFYFDTGKVPVSKDCSDAKIRYLAGRRILRLPNIIIRIYLHFLGTKILVFGGGSIFHSYNSISWKLKLSNSFRHKKTSSRIVLALGVSIGQFDDYRSKELMIDFCNNATLISVRDRRSFQLMSELGFSSKTVLGLDLAYALALNEPVFFHRTKQEVTHIGFCINGDEFFSRLSKLEQVNFFSLIEYFLRNGTKITLFNLYNSFESDDSILIQKISSNFSRYKNLYTHSFTGDIRETTHKLGECTHVCSTRLHGLIVADILKLPIITFSTQRKIRDFLQDSLYGDEVFLNLDSSFKELLDKFEIFLDMEMRSSGRKQVLHKKKVSMSEQALLSVIGEFHEC